MVSGGMDTRPKWADDESAAEEEEDKQAGPDARGRVWQPAALGAVGVGGVRAPRDAVAPELSLQRVPEEVEQRDGAPCESTTGVTTPEGARTPKGLGSRGLIRSVHDSTLTLAFSRRPLELEKCVPGR